MKKRIIYFVTLTGIIAIMNVSCGDAEQKEVIANETEKIVESVKEENDESVVVEKQAPDYAADFELLKEAIIKKDIRGVSAFASSDAIDAEVITNAFLDPDFLEQLKSKSFEDIQSRMEGEQELLELSLFLSGSDEEGNEYESGVYFYFSKGENGLLLENFLMAG